MAEAALAHAKRLDAYLESNNIPYPSFDEDTLEQLPDVLQDERWALANSSNELKKLARGAAMGTVDTALSVGGLPLGSPLLLAPFAACHLLLMQTLSPFPARQTAWKLTSALLVFLFL